MKYKVFDTLEEAMAYSQAEALKRGCTGTTKYWWSWITHEDGRSALCGEEFEEELDDSWFPKNEEM